MNTSVGSTQVFYRPGNVMIVDDEEELVEVVETVLKSAGHTVRTAGSTREAFEVLDEYSPDLFLLDYDLPDGNGIELCRQIKADSRYHEIPVILITGLGEEDIHVKSLDCGANDFMEKPVRNAVLLARVRSVLKYRNAVKALRKSNRLLSKANDDLRTLQKKREEIEQVVVKDLKEALILARKSANSGCVEEQSRTLSSAETACEKLIGLLRQSRAE